MEQTIIGRVPVARNFVSGNTYYKDNIVTYNGNTYKCKTDNTQTSPLNDNVNWELFAGDGKGRGIVNISTAYSVEILTLSFAQAIRKVPSSDRVLGFIGTYFDGRSWFTFQFIGDTLDDWLIADKWGEFPLHIKDIVDDLKTTELSCNPTRLKVVVSHRSDNNNISNSFDIPSVTEEAAGVMTSTDKIKLERLLSWAETQGFSL